MVDGGSGRASTARQLAQNATRWRAAAAAGGPMQAAEAAGTSPPAPTKRRVGGPSEENTGPGSPEAEAGELRRRWRLGLLAELTGDLMTNSHTIGSAPSVRTLAVGAGGNERPTLRSEPHYPPGHDCYSREIRRTDAGRRAALPHSAPPGGSHGGGPLFSRACGARGTTPPGLSTATRSRRTGPLWGRRKLWAGTHYRLANLTPLLWHQLVKGFEQVGRRREFRGSDTPKRRYPPMNHRTKHGLTHRRILSTTARPFAHSLHAASCAALPKAARCASTQPWPSTRPGGVVTRARHTPWCEGPTTVRAAGATRRDAARLPASVRLISRE